MSEQARQLLREIEAEYGLLCGLMLRADRMAADPFLWNQANGLSLRISSLRLRASRLHQNVLTETQNAAVRRANRRTRHV